MRQTGGTAVASGAAPDFVDVREKLAFHRGLLPKDALVQRRQQRLALPIEKAQADIATGAALAQHIQLFRAEDVAAAGPSQALARGISDRDILGAHVQARERVAAQADVIRSSRQTVHREKTDGGIAVGRRQIGQGMMAYGRILNAGLVRQQRLESDCRIAAPCGVGLERSHTHRRIV